MRALLIHADKFEYKSKSATKVAEELSEEIVRIILGEDFDDNIPDGTER